VGYRFRWLENVMTKTYAVPLLLLVMLVPLVTQGEPQPKLAPTALERSLATARLTWKMPDGFVSVSVSENRAMNYDIAIKAKRVKLEARYAIRIPGPEIKHENKTPVRGTALSEGLFMATILNISAGNDAPITWFDPKAASEEFGTPEGATAAFAPLADGWQGYKKCMMVGIEKDGAAAYAFFLFDDLAAVDPELRKAFHALRFAAK
jgi:hypothetical protein